MKVEFQLNGAPVECEGQPLERLLDVLRQKFSLTGTKEGCGEGECGTCTILMDGEPVLSCLIPLVQSHGRSVETVESLAAGDAEPFLERFVSAGGVQCGACTPGIITTAWALLRKTPRPDRSAVETALAGNLCRCTGYEGIVRALTGEGET